MNTQKIFEFIARMWIIARYDDFGQFDFLNKKYEILKAEGNSSIIMLEEDDPILINSRKLINFSYLLSSLINTFDDGYLGYSFLLSNDNEIFNPSKTCKHIPINILYGLQTFDYTKTTTTLCVGTFIQK